MCQGEIVTPLSPHPNMNPKPWFPNQQVIPLSRWLLKPVGNYSYSLNWRLQITNNRKKKVLAIDSLCHPDDIMSIHEAMKWMAWNFFLIWALFFWARQKHVVGIFGNTCHSPRKQEKIERNYVNLIPLSFFKSLMSWIWLFWTHKFVATERARVRTLKPHKKILEKLRKIMCRFFCLICLNKSTRRK